MGLTSRGGSGCWRSWLWMVAFLDALCSRAGISQGHNQGQSEFNCVLVDPNSFDPF